MHTWKVGGMSSTYGYSIPKTAYNYEVGPNSSNITYSAKIGLMYVSDFGYASSANYWTTALDTDDALKDNNWMCSGGSDWTISLMSSTTGSVFRIWGACSVDSNMTGGTGQVRPVFYLNSEVIYVNGSGTSSDPIRIS